jgi:hypothetical protein
MRSFLARAFSKFRAFWPRALAGQQLTHGSSKSSSSPSQPPSSGSQSVSSGPPPTGNCEDCQDDCFGNCAVKVTLTGGYTDECCSTFLGAHGYLYWDIYGSCRWYGTISKSPATNCNGYFFWGSVVVYCESGNWYISCTISPIWFRVLLGPDTNGCPPGLIGDHSLPRMTPPGQATSPACLDQTSGITLRFELICP